MLPACLCPRLADLAFAVTVRVHKAASWTTPLAAIVILLAALAAYHGSFSGPLIYDDVPAIADNKSIRHLLTALSPPHGEGLTVEGRPVLNLSLAINYAISGTGVWSYHVLNLVIHVLAGWTLFGIVRRTLCRMRIRRGDLPPSGDGPSLPDTPDGGSTLFALGAALLWTVHPLQTEAVTYIIQRAESMMGLFYLLTLYCLIRGADAERSASGGPAPAGRPGIWYGLSVAACLLGMGTKEVMITAPVMMLFYDRTFAAGTFAGAWRSRRVYYLALGATWIVLAALIASTGGNRSGSVGFGAGVTWSAYVLTQFEAIVHYLRLAVWPHPLVFEYGTYWMTLARAAPYAAIVALLAAATLWALVRAPAFGFLGFWFFGILAPTSLAPGTTQMIVEHRMYLPLAALAVLFMVAVHAIARRGRFWAIAGLAVGLGWTADGRNRDYRTELSIWEDTAARSPGNSRAHGNLADALISLGRTAEGLGQYKEALRLNPMDAVASNNFGIALSSLGRGEEAIPHFEQAVRCKPRYARAHYNLANALVKTGRLDEAVNHYEEALRLTPEYAEAANNLGNALMQAGRLGEAIPRFQEALRLDPDNAETRYNYGNALLRSDRLPEAISLLEDALRLDPGNAAAQSNLGIALVGSGRKADALAHFQEAVRLEPDYAEARFNLANDLLLLGRPSEAVSQYRETLRLRPDYSAARGNLERAEHLVAQVGGP
jgi:tetratricopeptide (TPR) repeat protein